MANEWSQVDDDNDWQLDYANQFAFAAHPAAGRVPVRALQAGKFRPVKIPDTLQRCKKIVSAYNGRAST